MERRRFLKLASASVIASFALRGRSFAADLDKDAMLTVIESGLGETNNPQNVIVVGAGMAGLVAAMELKRAGHKVTILEASTSVGGRVWTLREPVRGQSEGLPESEPHPHPFREFARELASVLPPFTLFSLARAGGARVVAWNLAAAAVVIVVAGVLIAWVGDPEQWIALGVGAYSTFSWGQGLRLRDPPTFAMIFRSRAMLLLSLGFASFAFVTYGLGFWTPSFFELAHGQSKTEIGTVLGLSAAAGGLIGVTGGGWLSDLLKQRTPNARLWLGGLALLLSAPTGYWLLTTPSLMTAYVLNFLFATFSPLWLGSGASAVNELVMPRMRAVASAFYILVLTFIGLAMGPYTMGEISDSLATAGASPAEALRGAMVAGLAMLGVAAGFLLLASRFLPAEEASRLERARAAGEPL